MFGGRCLVAKPEQIAVRQVAMHMTALHDRYMAAALS